jgi:Glu-tRNA(Gln) amidotransferase subunit E-like FAD-binding protein
MNKRGIKMKLDYKKLGLKCGVEIHQQLLTKHKLFCKCSAAFRDRKPVFEIKRRLRPVAGELGDIDVAAAFEALKNKSFRYKVYLNETCAVELDEEPPHPVNQEALDIALQVALLLNCEIPDEIQVMRKTVLDGSAVSGFQRTALVGLNGWIETSFGKVGITNVCLEEDAAQIIKKEKDKVVYGLNRLGIPLVEIGTSPDIHKPEQAREVAEKIGMILRSTGKAKRGIGTIRQDLNVSISRGARCEIKGVQKLNLLPRIVELEARRQKGLADRGKKVTRDVRRALPDGKTDFLRPLPGAARLYPETDCILIRITEEKINEIRKKLPELISDKKAKIIKKYRLSAEMAKQIADSGRADLFGELALVYKPRVVAAALTSYLKQLKSEGAAVENLTDKVLKKLFQSLKGKEIPKEKLIHILEKLAEKPDTDIKKLLGKTETVPDSEVRKLIKGIVKENRAVLKQHNAEKILMGMVMKELRGKVSGRVVVKVLREEMK